MKKKRPLLDQEVRFLCTLWKWKILSYQLSHVLGFHELSFWRSYKIVLRLLREGYISEHSVLGTKVRVLQLTKKGFSQIRYELGDLKELRFNPQSVTHDYWATVFQLGPFAPDLLDNTSFITEQEVQAFESGVLPDWISESRDHIPDGFPFPSKKRVWIGNGKVPFLGFLVGPEETLPLNRNRRRVGRKIREKYKRGFSPSKIAQSLLSYRAWMSFPKRG